MHYNPFVLSLIHISWSDPAQNIIDQAGLTGSYAELYKLLEIDTSGLEQAVETAKSLSGSDYDRISWNELEQALYAAEAYLSGGSLSQGSVDMMSRRPVSYTHLDVYKRQWMAPAAR